MTHQGRYADGCVKRKETTKNNSSTEGWSQRLVLCHICLLFLRIPPVQVESETVTCRYPAFAEKDKTRQDSGKV